MGFDRVQLQKMNSGSTDISLSTDAKPISTIKDVAWELPTSSSQLLDKALDKYTKAKDLKDKELETYSGDKRLLLTFRENGTDGLDGINEETSLIFEFQEDGKVDINDEAVAKRKTTNSQTNTRESLSVKESIDLIASFRDFDKDVEGAQELSNVITSKFNQHIKLIINSDAIKDSQKKETLEAYLPHLPEDKQKALKEYISRLQLKDTKKSDEFKSSKNTTLPGIRTGSSKVVRSWGMDSSNGPSVKEGPLHAVMRNKLLGINFGDEDEKN